jgi:hypothetical protein
MSEQPEQDRELPEDDGVLEPADSLETDDLSRDPLDTGLIAPDRPSAPWQFGGIPGDAAEVESFDRRLAEEQPDPGAADYDLTDDEDYPDGSLPEPRAGRLVAADEGSHRVADPGYFARDVGIDGGAAGAEEAAVHIVDEDAEVDENGNALPDF